MVNSYIPTTFVFHILALFLLYHVVLSLCFGYFVVVVVVGEVNLVIGAWSYETSWYQDFDQTEVVII